MLETDETIDEEAIERGQGVSLWRQIDQSLSREIASGNWQPGEKLPTEQALSIRFGVNRHTIRRAIQAMVQRGLLRVEQGRGTFVQEGIIDYVVGRRTRFTENIQRNRRHPSYEVLKAGEMLPPFAVARQLKLAPRAPVVMVERLSSAGGSPISLSTMYFPAARFAGFDKAHAEAGSVTEALKRFGVADYTRAVTRLTARLPTAEEARHLKQPVTRPVLLSEAVDIDAEGVPIAVNVTRFASDRVQIVFGGDGSDAMPQPDLSLLAR
ncbi:MAG TPA: phosphonate metabolism transcriptional regulator PhnF [Aliidongia sp.]|nr:phosphonate metabolism transcriptional regulator PhnF [Aliidongia sp.]